MTGAHVILTPGWVPHMEKLLNRALAMDEETLMLLAQLTGKTLGFHFINIQLTLYLHPSAKGLGLATVCAGKPNVMIKGTPIDFITMMALSKDGKPNTIPADMELAGDVGLAQRFQYIMQNIEIDLEEPLSRWVGDTAAFHIGKFISGTHRLAVNASVTLARDMSEYLRFENEMLPDDLLVARFCHDVDTLRDDVDRLVQGVQKLATKIPLLEPRAS